MKKSIPDDPKTQGITGRIRRIFFRTGIKNAKSTNSPKNVAYSDRLPRNVDTPIIPEDLQYAYEKYNGIVEDIQKLQQEAVLKREKIGLGKYATDLLKAIYDKDI